MFWTFNAGWNACMVATALRDGNHGWAAVFGAFMAVWLLVALVLAAPTEGEA